MHALSLLLYTHVYMSIIYIYIYVHTESAPVQLFIPKPSSSLPPTRARSRPGATLGLWAGRGLGVQAYREPGQRIQLGFGRDIYTSTYEASFQAFA